MPPIILDHLDNALLAKIGNLAKARNVSVEEQIETLIREALHGRRDALLDRADAIAAMTPKGVKQTDSTLLVREDRDQ